MKRVLLVAILFGFASLLLAQSTVKKPGPGEVGFDPGGNREAVSTGSNSDVSGGGAATTFNFGSLLTTTGSSGSSYHEADGPLEVESALGALLDARIRELPGVAKMARASERH
jgi:hypothetical protein